MAKIKIAEAMMVIFCFLEKDLKSTSHFGHKVRLLSTFLVWYNRIVWFDSLRLSDNRLDKLSDIASDLALIAVASVALPAVLDRYDPVKDMAGVATAIFLWTFSVWLRR